MRRFSTALTAVVLWTATVVAAENWLALAMCVMKPSSRNRLAIMMLVFVTLAATISPAVQATGTVSINVSTGLNSSGSVQTTSGAPDAHWTVDGQPAQVVTTASADWGRKSGGGGWMANDSHSAWIARRADDRYYNVGTYSCVFNLTGVDLSTVVIAGGWAIDDAGSLTLNGNLIAAGGSIESLMPFSVAAAAHPSWFNQDSNMLTLTITATDYLCEGVRLAGTVTGTTPEPASSVLVALGGCSLLVRRRRRPSRV